MNLKSHLETWIQIMITVTNGAGSWIAGLYCGWYLCINRSQDIYLVWNCEGFESSGQERLFLTRVWETLIVNRKFGMLDASCMVINYLNYPGRKSYPMRLLPWMKSKWKPIFERSIEDDMKTALRTPSLLYYWCRLPRICLEPPERLQNSSQIWN